MKLFTYYLPLCVLAGYAALTVLGFFGFWIVYLYLAYVAARICADEALIQVESNFYVEHD